MLTIGIFPNMKNKEVPPLLRRLVAYFAAHQAAVALPEHAAQSLGRPELAADEALLSRHIDLALTLGGDGTLLCTARLLAPAGIPVCGVNMGRLGFLTEVEVADLDEALAKIMAGDYSVERRLMLHAQVSRAARPIHSATALNDVVITKGGFARIITMQLYIDGHLTARYNADGLIVATGTGSTGYSLSAGGPIVNPMLPVIVVTPICPHTLDARSLIVADYEEIKVEVQASHEDICMTTDGQTTYRLLPQDIVVVRKSSLQARFLKLCRRSYYETLRAKLRRGEAR